VSSLSKSLLSQEEVTLLSGETSKDLKQFYLSKEEEEEGTMI